MGTVNHNAVIATTWSDEQLEKIQDWIALLPNDQHELFVVGNEVSGYQTIVLVPDGCREGAAGSNEYDALRDRFIKQLSKVTYPDGSSPWAWVEVGFGEYGQKILRGNNRNCYDDREYKDD